jgi:Amt family ammonium transporter
MPARRAARRKSTGRTVIGRHAAPCANLEEALERSLGDLRAHTAAIRAHHYGIDLHRSTRADGRAQLDELLAGSRPELDPAATALRATTARYRTRKLPSGPLTARLIATGLVDPLGLPLGLLIVLRDPAVGAYSESEQRRTIALGKEVSALIVAHYDAATGLLSRAAFEQRFAAWRAAGPSRRGCLLYGDLDRLHALNKLAGFEAGDRAIGLVGEALRAEKLPEGSLACHLSGDRFTVLLPEVSLTEARATAERIGQSVASRPLGLAGASDALSISIGVAPLFDDETLHQALAAAESACRAAKDRGRGRVECYEDADQSIIRRNADVLIADFLRKALAEDRLELCAQRIVRLDGREPSPRYELLVRLIGEAGKRIPPAEFMSAAQRYGLLADLDRAVVSHALRMLAAHRERLERSPARFSINVSGPTLSEAGFASWLAERLEESRIPGGWLQVELTETAAVGNVPQTQKLIEVLAARGVEFALDDFGTGMSSLAYLRSFNVKMLKLDGSFVRDLGSDARADSLVQGVAQLARSMGIETVAECIETPEVLARIERLGIDCAQGFLYGAPRALEEILGGSEGAGAQAAPAPAASSGETYADLMAAL